MPASSLDSSGNLYGTTWGGGLDGVGTVFELSPIVGGGWTETLLHNFLNNGIDGAYPEAGLIFDAKGNLYGTTSRGADGYGTVFELAPTAGGGWIEKVLHSFKHNRQDGNYPYAGAILDAAGHLYGMTGKGGADNLGTVFEIKP
jgi:uncharacterized repeat protein (TIGR03803 family)